MLSVALTMGIYGDGVFCFWNAGCSIGLSSCIHLGGVYVVGRLLQVMVVA
jgi:hypothetical protein